MAQTRVVAARSFPNEARHAQSLAGGEAAAGVEPSLVGGGASQAILHLGRQTVPEEGVLGVQEEIQRFRGHDKVAWAWRATWEFGLGIWQ